MSEFEKFFEIKFPNIQATIDQSHCDESILLKKACRMTWNARQKEIDQFKAENLRLSGLLKEQKRCFDECSQMVSDLIKERDQLKAEKADIESRFDKASHAVHAAKYNRDVHLIDVDIDSIFKSVKALRGDS